MNIDKWIAHESVNESNKINLLCFIFDGGSASYFAPWKYKLAGDINLIPILYPQREKRRTEKMYENMKLFIEDLVKSLETIFKNQYAFFGYCSGAVLAYEAAVLAKEYYNVDPVYGMIISSEAPKYLPNTVPSCSEENKEQLFLKHMSGLPTISDEMFNDRVFLEYYEPIITADYDLLRTYRYKEHEKLNCDFDVIMSPSDVKVERKKVKEWEKLTNGKTHLFEKEGGHFLVEQQEAFIFQRLNNRLSLGESKNFETRKKVVEEYTEVYSERQAYILSVWKKILNLETLYGHDNFFLKGGDSIKAAQIVNYINKETGANISITDILKNPEVFALAECVEKKLDHEIVDEGEI